MSYFMSLNPLSLFRAMPGSIAQGMIWGVMALGVYITFRLLDFADLTVDGSIATGAAVSVMLIRAGVSPIATLPIAFLAGALAGMVTGLLNTALGIPGILASILTQISLYSINLNIMGKANQPVSVDNYPLVVSLRYVTGGSVSRLLFFLGMIVFLLALIAVMYWYFGTEQGHAIRATGCNSNMARAQGINTNFIKVLALMISNGLVGLCGALYGQFQGASDVNMGRGAIVIGLAAVIIGECGSWPLGFVGDAGNTDCHVGAAPLLRMTPSLTPPYRFSETIDAHGRPGAHFYAGILPLIWTQCKSLFVKNCYFFWNFLHPTPRHDKRALLLAARPLFFWELRCHYRSCAVNTISPG